jgi:predicted flavoprotein YhiN
METSVTITGTALTETAKVTLGGVAVTATKCGYGGAPVFM